MKILLALLLTTSFASAQLLSRKGLTNNYVPVFRGGVLANAFPVATNHGGDGSGTHVFTDDGTFKRSNNTEGAEYVTVHLSNLPSGDNDLYAVPAGKRASIVSAIAGTTNALGTAVRALAKTNGVYYAIQASTTPVATAPVSFGVPAFMFEENETIALNTSNMGLNAVLLVQLLPNTTKYKTHRLYSLSAGTNLLYTVPAGYRVTSIQRNFLVFNTAAVTGSYVNFSGGARTFKIYYVPSGDSVSDGNRFANVSVSDAGSQALLLSGLAAGDSVVAETDASTSNQVVYIHVLEVPL